MRFSLCLLGLCATASVLGAPLPAPDDKQNSTAVADQHPQAQNGTSGTVVAAAGAAAVLVAAGVGYALSHGREHAHLDEFLVHVQKSVDHAAPTESKVANFKPSKAIVPPVQPDLRDILMEQSSQMNAKSMKVNEELRKLLDVEDEIDQNFMTAYIGDDKAVFRKALDAEFDLGKSSQTLMREYKYLGDDMHNLNTQIRTTPRSAKASEWRPPASGSESISALKSKLEAAEKEALSHKENVLEAHTNMRATDAKAQALSRSPDAKNFDILWAQHRLTYTQEHTKMMESLQKLGDIEAQIAQKERWAAMSST